MHGYTIGEREFEPLHKTAAIAAPGVVDMFSRRSHWFSLCVKFEETKKTAPERKDQNTSPVVYSFITMN